MESILHNKLIYLQNTDKCSVCLLIFFLLGGINVLHHFIMIANNEIVKQQME